MARNTIYTLYSTGRVDPTFANIWGFENEAQRELFLNSKSPVVIPNNKYWRVGATIKIPYSYEDSFNFDYIRIDNDATTAKVKTYYAFITGRAYLSQNATILTLALDYVQTWYFSSASDGGKFPWWQVIGYVNRATVRQAYETRRGTPTDYPVPEISCNYNETTPNIYRVLVYSSVDLRDFTETSFKYTSAQIDGVYMAAPPYLLPLVGSLEMLSTLVSNLNKAGLTDAISGVYLVPIRYCSYDNGQIVLATPSMFNPPKLSVNKPTSCQGYIPRNKVLLSHDYSYFTISNGQGEIEAYHFEDFDGNPRFNLSVSLTAGYPVLIAYPENYRYGAADDHVTHARKVTTPISAAYLNDSYKIWLAQTQNSRAAAINGANLAISQAREAREKSWAYRYGTGIKATEDALRESLFPAEIESTSAFGGGQSAGGGAGRSFDLSPIGRAARSTSALLSGALGAARGMTEYFAENTSVGGALASGVRAMNADNVRGLYDIATSYINNQLGIETTYIYDQNVASAQQNLSALMASYRDKARVPATATGSNAYGDLAKLGQYGFMVSVYTPNYEWAETLDDMLTASGQTINDYTSTRRNHRYFDFFAVTSPDIESNYQDRPQYVRNMLVALITGGVYIWHYADGDISPRIGTPYKLANPEV